MKTKLTCAEIAKVKCFLDELILKAEKDNNYIVYETARRTLNGLNDLIKLT